MKLQALYDDIIRCGTQYASAKHRVERILGDTKVNLVFVDGKPESVLLNFVGRESKVRVHISAREFQDFASWLKGLSE